MAQLRHHFTIPKTNNFRWPTFQTSLIPIFTTHFSSWKINSQSHHQLALIFVLSKSLSILSWTEHQSLSTQPTHWAAVNNTWTMCVWVPAVNQQQLAYIYVLTSKNSSIHIDGSTGGSAHWRHVIEIYANPQQIDVSTRSE